VADSSKSGAVARWLALQLAAKALSLALGAPIVAAVAMSGIAILRGLPLEWAFPAVLLSAAAASTLLNQIRTFILSTSASDKLILKRVDVRRAVDDDGREGYAVAVFFENSADTALEYEVIRISAHLNGMIARHSPGTKGGLVAAGEARGYMIGLVPMELVINSTITGEVEVNYRYGRPGKMSYERTRRLRTNIMTDVDGDIATVATFILP
jgi:hypothetical protein